MVLHRVSESLACCMDQNRSFFCLQLEDGSAVELWDAKCPSSRRLPSSIFIIIKIFVVLTENHCGLDIALICGRAIAGQEVGWNYVLDNSHHSGCKEGHILPFIKWCAEVHTDFTTATKEESRLTISFPLFARYPRLDGSVSVVWRQSCFVMYCTSSGASTPSENFAFWRSWNAWSQCFTFSSTVEAASPRKRVVADGVP